MKVYLSIAVLITLFLFAGCSSERAVAVPSVQSALPVPETILLDGTILRMNRTAYSAGDEETTAAMERLLRLAGELMASPPVSVTEKEFLPPSGDIHDYMSMGPYWWPDTTKPGGLPYIRRDGVVNPERTNFDKPRIVRMYRAVYILSLAYFFTAREEYAEKAAGFLDTWFLDPATAMNPNFNYGQFVPGRKEGRAPGIIEARAFLQVMDSALLLERSPHWSGAQMAALRSWYGQFLDWLLESPLGQKEQAARNNHGSWAAVQISAYARFCGRTDLAASVAKEAFGLRLESQIAADGSQPEELVRTKSFSYSCFNLHALMVLAHLLEEDGVAAWQNKNSVGSGLAEALDYLVSAVERDTWPHGEMNDPFWRSDHFLQCLYLAAANTKQTRYRDLADRLLGATERNESRILELKLVYRANN